MPRARLVDSATWKAAPEAERGDLAILKTSAGSVGHLTKALTLEVRSLGGDPDRTLPFKISQGSRDRDGDRLDPQGWELANFAANPVVLWAHQYSQLPVGKSLKTWVSASTDQGTSLKALKQFARADENPMADLVFRLIKGGYLNTASVGFRPIAGEPDVRQPDEPEGTRIGMRFSKQELYESSIVPVPSNPNALHEAKSVGGIDLSPLVGSLEQALDEARGEAGLWVPRKTLEAARVIAKGGTAIIFDLTVGKGVAADGVGSGSAEGSSSPSSAPVVSEPAAPDPEPPAEGKAAVAGQRQITVSGPDEALEAQRAVADFLLGLVDAEDPGASISRVQAMRLDNAIDLAEQAADAVLEALGVPEDDEGEAMAGMRGADTPVAKAEPNAPVAAAPAEPDAAPPAAEPAPEPEAPAADGEKTYLLDPGALSEALLSAMRGAAATEGVPS